MVGLLPRSSYGAVRRARVYKGMAADGREVDSSGLVISVTGVAPQSADHERFPQPAGSGSLYGAQDGTGMMGASTARNLGEGCMSIVSYACRHPD